MSAEALGWAMRLDVGNATDKLVLIGLANQANDFDLSGRAIDGHHALASVPALQKLAMCSETRVFTALTCLMHLGLVSNFEFDADRASVSVEIRGVRS